MFRPEGAPPLGSSAPRAGLGAPLVLAVGAESVLPQVHALGRLGPGAGQGWEGACLLRACPAEGRLGLAVSLSSARGISPHPAPLSSLKFFHQGLLSAFLAGRGATALCPWEGGH